MSNLLNNRYRVLKVTGKGTFGFVLKCYDELKEELVALKFSRIDERYKNRELEIHGQLNHHNIVNLIDSFILNTQQILKRVFVMDFYQFDGVEIWKEWNGFERNNIFIASAIIFQITKALNYLHNKNIVHRDIKPSNLLFNPLNLHSVLCDFGCAKILIEGESSVSYIVSRGYRPIELFCNSTEYSLKIDIWSLGVTFFELITGERMFRNTSRPEGMIYQICKRLGIPSEHDLDTMKINIDRRIFYDIAKHIPNRIEKPWKYFRSNKLKSLFEGMMNFNINKRLSAYQILNHSFFKQIFNKFPSQLEIFPGKFCIPESEIFIIDN